MREDFDLEEEYTADDIEYDHLYDYSTEDDDYLKYVDDELDLVDDKLLELGHLIAENPDVPVIPMCHADIKINELEDFWFKAVWGDVFLAHYFLHMELGLVVKEWIEDKELFKEFVTDVQNHTNRKLDYEKFRNEALRGVEEAPWKEAIFINVEPLPRFDENKKTFYDTHFALSADEVQRILDEVIERKVKMPDLINEKIKNDPKFNDSIKELGQLIQENRHIPIIPVVAGDVIGDSNNCNRWKSTIGNSYVSKYVIHPDHGLYVQGKDRSDEIFEAFFNRDMYESSFEESDDDEDYLRSSESDDISIGKKKEKIRELPWKDAIIVEIIPLDNMDFYDSRYISEDL